MLHLKIAKFLVIAVLIAAATLQTHEGSMAERLALGQRKHPDTHEVHSVSDERPHPVHSHMGGSNTTNALVPIPHRPKHGHGMSILHLDLLPEERLFWESYSTETFFTTPSKRRAALYIHIASYVGSYIFVFPFVLVFWNTHHGLYFPALTLHTGLIVLSAINFWIFCGSTRADLYPHSAFSIMSTWLFVGSIVHWIIALLALGYRARNIEHEYEYAELDFDKESLSVHSPTLTLRELNLRLELFELDDLNAASDGHLQTSNGSMLRLKPTWVLLLLHNHPFLEKATHFCGKTALTLAMIVNWALFAYFLVYFPTGLATYLRYGQDEFKFNLLAHFIKGGVFFVLGMVTLARYCGAFRGQGWAWNHRFVTASSGSSRWLQWQNQRLCTMEMVESCLVLFYGSTNIFMEHLANAGGEWSAKDLQHASIAFIYIGCGLCGVLLEKMLAAWRFQKAVENASVLADAKKLASVTKATPGFSPNPFPVLTIYWTGVLMSLHEQASHLSSEIHKQWGNMFVLACAFRVLTYMYCLVKALDSAPLTRPVHPITELFVAFGLLCGGAIFMESCDSVVYLLEYYGFTLMFTLNLSLGFVALLMAWIMAIFSIKDAIKARQPGQKSSV